MYTLLLQSTPVPRDIPLDLPLPEWALVIILVISFLLHIIFVNLMLGGTILTLWAELKGLKNPDYDVFAEEIAKTVTVNKSIAVVLGVAPLLSINVLYTVYFYSANALTGLMWISIIPLVTIAFLLTYLHKYTWKKLMAYKGLHISIIAVSALLFLFIPLIFLVNVNLMLFPDKWGTVKGFISALVLPNVFPRYLHFICASLAVTGLFLFWYAGRKSYPFEEKFSSLTRYEVKRRMYSLALGASVTQFLIGPIVLVTLPSRGMGWNLLAIILTGAAIALPAIYWMWKAITGPPEKIDTHYWKVVMALTITVLFMGSGRHVYRNNSIALHKKYMEVKTKEFSRLSAEARKHPVQKDSNLNSSPAEGEKGAALFKANCAVCHQKDSRLVGPPVLEMVKIYRGNSNALKSWIKAPGKKRPDYPQMPAFGDKLSASDLNELAKYILSVK